MVGKEQDRAATGTAERRADARTKTGKSVLLRMPEGPPVEAWLLDVSHRGLRLRVPERVPVGVSVKIEARELLLFGTVVRCQVAHGAYEAGVALSLPLDMLGELRRLNAALVRESEPR